MQLDYKQSLVLAKSYQQKLKKIKNEVVLAPDFTVLDATTEIIKKSPLKLGAQDCAFGLQGAYTGEISVKSLKQLGVKYVLIGHSERRGYFKEDSGLLKFKVAAALENGLVPVFCIGEKLTDYKTKRTHVVLRRQLEEVLFGLEINNESAVVIAYEPVWAIGSGKTPAAKEIEANHVFIKGVLAELIGQIPRVIYGGSVNSKNAAELLEWPNVDGLLVGGASLNVDEFSKIVNV